VAGIITVCPSEQQQISYIEDAKKIQKRLMQWSVLDFKKCYHWKIPVEYVCFLFESLQ